MGAILGVLVLTAMCLYVWHLRPKGISPALRAHIKKRIAAIDEELKRIEEGRNNGTR